MALANPSVQDRRPSPSHLSINLSSNNPFRNRTTSPSPRIESFNLGGPVSPQPSFQTANMSKNPFLDASEVSPQKNENINQDAVRLAADIFGGVSLESKPKPQNGPPPRPRGNPPGRPGPPSIPADRLTRPPRDAQSPLKSEARRPRGLSDTSIPDRRERDRRERDPAAPRDRPPRTESEERRRQERRKERDERYRNEKDKTKKSGRSRKPQGLDLIDKLDVTGIYGQGLFHHDGPFDACNPHRNKKHHKAPMQAFPAGSANMALGGNGPLNARLDLDRFHGRGEESFSEYAGSGKTATNIVNPLDRAPQVHGNETIGLGTSTFLEGAPAPRSALQRRQSEDPSESIGGGGLSRKKSLAQRLRSRGMSNSRNQRPEPFSPEARYGSMSDDSPPQAKATSAGGIPRTRFNNENEVNPFDKDYLNVIDRRGSAKGENEKLGASVTFAREVSSRGPGLSRSITADESPANIRPYSRDDTDRASSIGSGGGLLSRMKSIKGGRRPKPDRD